MPTFEYAAKDETGKRVSGLLFASDEERAHGDLRRRGLAVETLSPAQATAVGREPGPATAGRERTATSPGGAAVEGPPVERRSYAATSVWGPLVGRVPLAQLAFYFRQLGTMLNAGVPMVQALDTLSRQATSSKLKSVVAEIRGHVEAGRPMSAGMQRYPEVFTPVVMTVTRVGEEGGFLDRAMHQIADYLDREIELRAIYRRVTFMPKVELALSAIIVMGANLIIGSINSKAMKLSSPLTNAATWVWLGPLLVGIFIFLRLGLANPAVRYAWDAFVSHIPYLGKTLRQLAMAKFGRAFGAMYASGVPLPRALALSADACGNEWMRARIAPLPGRLEGGQGIAATLASSGAFSPIVLDMIATGEATGSLDGMLGKVSEYYEHEAETRATQTAQIVGVVIALCVMLYIAWIIVGFYQGYGAQTTGQINDTMSQ